MDELFDGGDGGVLNAGAAVAAEGHEGDAADETHEAAPDEGIKQVLRLGALGRVADGPGEDHGDDKAAEEKLEPGDACAGLRDFDENGGVEEWGLAVPWLARGF